MIKVGTDCRTGVVGSGGVGEIGMTKVGTDGGTGVVGGRG